MKIESRFAFGGLVAALSIATAAGCAKPTPSNGAPSGTAGTTSTTGGHPGGTGSGGTTTTGSGGVTATGSGGATATGSGGATATGSGGATGGGVDAAPVVQKDCATKTVVMNPVFMNFENYTGIGTMTADNYVTAFGGTTVNSGNAYAGLFPYPEVKGGTNPTLAIVAGHPPSNWAGSETWQATVWGMGGGLWMGCADASAYKGISFWVRGTSGTGMFQFSISMENTQLPAANPAGGGTCPGTTDTCVDPSMQNIPLTADWTQVQILWSDFTPGSSGGTTVVPNGDKIVGMGWTVPLQFQRDTSVAADAAGAYVGVPEALRLDIDDISFIQ